MIWTLIPVSLIYGLIAALVFRRLSSRQALRIIANRMMAHVMEFRLYLDSPALVLRAQRELFRENLRLLRLIALPCVVLATLFIILFPPFDAMYGHAPLRTGERSVITLQLRDSPGSSSLKTPDGIDIETPGMYAIQDRQISWRIRPRGNVSGDLTLLHNGQVLKKRIISGTGLVYSFQLPFTKPAIDLHYPRITILGLNWMVWFFLISTAAAIAF